MSTRVDWRGRALRRSGMPIEKALAIADEWRATRLARGGKAGEHHYDTHRALERLAREVRRLWRYAPRKVRVVDFTARIARLDPSVGPLTALLGRRMKP